jgi:D-alanyl-D-alanine carboxypeptidase/D-alanyl-D-alanine-endopeptidase (penicillin-binding protein 4)
MKLLSLLLLSLVAVQTFASDRTDNDWSQQLRGQGLDKNEQAYCFTDDQGKLQGKNPDLRVRIASVSKLFVSLWSLQKLGINHKFNTKLFIKDNVLHIAGSYDPFLGNEKMFFLVSQLNELGYTKFSKITFDKNLLINPDVQYESDEYPAMNAVTNGRYLKMYFNPSSWSKDTKDEYANYYALAKKGRYLKEVKFEVPVVQFVDKNPLENEADVKTLTLSSPELYRYLKEMNVKSNNYVAETIFRQLGASDSFHKFLMDDYSISSDWVHFYSGSGLPTYINGERKDNIATCANVMEIISELKKSAVKQGFGIEDVMAVPGSDGGTFRNRIFSADYKNSFVAKTGTLMHTSALAGAMNTQNGFSFFGIFNQSEDIVGSKIVQNAMVKSIMTEMGGPKAFDYVVDGFHTYDGDTVKSRDPINLEDFSSVDGDLL